MNKICKGIDHVVVLKNLDEYRSKFENGQYVEDKTEANKIPYRCVLQNLGDDTYIVNDSPVWKYATEDGKTVKYTIFTFQGLSESSTTAAHSITKQLGEGKVSLSVSDKGKQEVVYYNKNYAKVFETQLGQD